MEQTMIRPKKPPLISTTQFAAIVVLTIVLFLVIDFGRRTTAGYYVSQTEKRLEAQIETLLEQQKVLKQRRDYVQTDEYVEQWAREQAHMVRPGDHRLIVVTPPAPSDAPDAATPAAPPPRNSTAARQPVPNWHHWWRLFWDTEPGTLRRW
jgi:cell division protein FtsB